MVDLVILELKSNITTYTKYPNFHKASYKARVFNVFYAKDPLTEREMEKGPPTTSQKLYTNV